jgi:hypothetical protein
VHLINVGGDHANKAVMRYDELAPLTSLKVKLRTRDKPASVTVQPEGKKLPFTYQSGYTEIAVSAVPIHSIIEIKPGL